jgi:hypothetical protein
MIFDLALAASARRLGRRSTLDWKLERTCSALIGANELVNSVLLSRKMQQRGTHDRTISPPNVSAATS